MLMSLIIMVLYFMKVNIKMEKEMEKEENILILS